MGFDDRGKVKLSMRVVDQQTGEDLEKKEREAAPAAPWPTETYRRPQRLTSVRRVWRVRHSPALIGSCHNSSRAAPHQRRPVRFITAVCVEIVNYSDS